MALYSPSTFSPGTAMYTPAFQNLLMLMSRIKTEEELTELSQVVSDFYARRVDEEMDKLWEDGVINDEVIEGWTHEHMRTPYRCQNA